MCTSHPADESGAAYPNALLDVAIRFYIAGGYKAYLHGCFFESLLSLRLVMA
jgi:hypothetical protein